MRSYASGGVTGVLPYMHLQQQNRNRLLRRLGVGGLVAAPLLAAGAHYLPQMMDSGPSVEDFSDGVRGAEQGAKAHAHFKQYGPMGAPWYGPASRFLSGIASDASSAFINRQLPSNFNAFTQPITTYDQRAWAEAHARNPQAAENAAPIIGPQPVSSQRTEVRTGPFTHTTTHTRTEADNIRFKGSSRAKKSEGSETVAHLDAVRLRRLALDLF